MAPKVWLALNTAYRERIQRTPFQLIMGRAPPSTMSVIASTGQDRWDGDLLDDVRIREIVKKLVKRKEAFRSMIYSNEGRLSIEGLTRQKDKGRATRSFLVSAHTFWW